MRVDELSTSKKAAAEDTCGRTSLSTEIYRVGFYLEKFILYKLLRYVPDPALK